MTTVETEEDTDEEVRAEVKDMLGSLHTELAKQTSLYDIISYWNNPRHEHAQVLTEPCLASLCIKYLMELANKLLHLPEADEQDSYIMHCATMSYVTSFFLMQCMVRTRWYMTCDFIWRGRTDMTTSFHNHHRTSARLLTISLIGMMRRRARKSSSLGCLCSAVALTVTSEVSREILSLSLGKIWTLTWRARSIFHVGKRNSQSRL